MQYDNAQTFIDAELAEIEELAHANQFHGLLSNYEWRMNNLYKIKDFKGNAIQFQMNWAQHDFLAHAHYFNLVLKARQLGFSTVIDLDLLDTALFNDNQSCGIIAQTEGDAQKLLDNVLFTYERLPEWLKAWRPLKKQNTEEMQFGNGSKIVSGTSLRGGTYQKLHVSEYGKTSIKFPEKAREIKTGAFNTVHAGQIIYVESTAEGQRGEFFELTKLARAIDDTGRPLTPLDPKFFFYAWHDNPNYEMPFAEAQHTIIDEEMQTYFRNLEQDHAISLTLEQKAWYVTKAKIMGEDMMREFPSTPDEAFAASVEGAIYSKQMRMLRRSGQITRVPYDPRYPVHTFWDFGNANYMAIWFFQQVGREFRMIRYYQSAGRDFASYIQYMKDLEYNYGNHYVPHDGAITRMMETGNKTYKVAMENLGLRNVIVVPVTRSVWKDIEFKCKPMLPLIWFDEVNCAKGIACLDMYRKKKDKDGLWLQEPEHDEYSDGADAFRTFVMGYKEVVNKAPVSFKMESGSPY